MLLLAGEQVYGPESSGKTTVALHAVAQCQKAGERGVLSPPSPFMEIMTPLVTFEDRPFPFCEDTVTTC